MPRVRPAQRNHPNVKQLQHNVTLSELAIRAAAAERLPQVTGSVGLSQQEGGYTTRTGGHRDEPGRSIPVARCRRRIARRLRIGDGTRAALSQAGLSVAEGTAQAWAQIDVYRAQIRAYSEQIQAAQIAYDGVKEEATLGARTTLDVLDAEQNLLDARASRINAEADLQVAYYQLLSAMGLLTVEDLKLGSRPMIRRPITMRCAMHPRPAVQGESLDRVLRAIGKPEAATVFGRSRRFASDERRRRFRFGAFLV